MAKKNSKSAQKAEHQLRLERERAIREKRENKAMKTQIKKMETGGLVKKKNSKMRVRLKRSGAIRSEINAIKIKGAPKLSKMLT
mmetsp:Transcript_48391/g.109940  ORF Transcript_48391/g.109940 Transcript_48391/m.109940 type:complete len:84 (+) Transcript_48391:118-369(+)|eukprot:CAMPEP_0172625074 /NCGR_PEP_ID=MMETSP1068-20121228/141241_1 /TAXON_ID=35684 /ORGANISM="Pseudopedinella elastica, Strain CCMP716" /LENGTH=83 /DNA_ID=CAMNT_0013434251 /DNA_START=42 /DNA_END=293 /DNA_ORIENTATION=+